MLTEQEIEAIIGRVRGRVEAVEGRNHTGPALRAAAERAALSSKLGDGIYASIDEAIAAARRAFAAYRGMGLEKRRVIVDAMRSATLRANCIEGIEVNREICEDNIARSIGVVTALVPVLGYKSSTALAAEALTTGKGVVELVREQGLLSEEQIAEVLAPERMARPLG